eukprot:CAMPEP_0194372264 /NCGR_PEP_ID=MMETSP0174-20130528/20598_1 /TAXON_ID=216777 /ORGANISM="Proboscia alata, Strain PI-D3" /LENGTH=167 /DNA_ID=CAMNT_0039150681 /DNA_START=258 /DNA_END=757 /DNA_ORIENTATION=+
MKTLTKLSKVGMISMISIACLGLAIVYRSITCVSIPRDDTFAESSPYLPPSWVDVYDAIPLLLSGYMCHFNAISVHNELIDPTPSRSNAITTSTIVISTLFYLAVGISGAQYARCTDDGIVSSNILLDFNDDDVLMDVGRVCLGITICFAFPMLIIPARDSLLRLYG